MSFLRYVFYRLLVAVPTVLIIISFAFFLAKLLPGDPITVMFGELQPPPEVRKALEEKLGLDKPIYVQLAAYVGRALQGDWGKSIHTGEPVTSLVARRFVATLELTLASIIISTLVGLLLAYISASRPNSAIDSLVRLISIGSYSIPVFWWGLMLILVFSVNLQLLPPGGKEGWRSLVLPSIALATVNLGMIARFSRAAMLEVYTQDFVTAARARGFAERLVMIRYVLRNALVPIVTLVGYRFGVLMGGAVITETVFNYPGMGKTIVDSIFARDYPVLLGSIMVISLTVVVVNLIVDILYAFLDPRVRVKA
ncbi:MAG: ABC transporter permease [Acidilobaceae archaeon]|nr:ABC transporter permease [Acidilobaceae archaeon]